MKVFELKDNQIIIDPNFLTIPIFGTIWDKDKSKDKHEAVSYFTYIYHVCDHASPYSNYPISKRMEAVQADLITDPKWKPSNDIKEAINKYRELSTTPMQRLLLAAQRKVDEIAEFLEETPVDAETVKPVLEVFNKLTLTVNNFGKLNEAVTKEQKDNNVKRRGEKSTSMFED
jgi:hypothetical protein